MNSPEAVVASDIFQFFCNANTMRNILGLHREICNVLNIIPTRFPDFYPKFRNMLHNCWKAQAFFKKIDARATLPEYKKGLACRKSKAFIIGAGPCGLRAAIELQLLGAKVVIIEKRDRVTRNNVVHLWPHVITDLRALGAKKFYGKFCAGSIDHISIRQLQCMLLKMALCLGVEFHENVEFIDLIEPTTAENSWRARVSPEGHPVSNFEFDCLIGADGRRNTLPGFPRKEFRGKMALAITVNFINKKTEIEAAVPEISGVSYIFRQKFFQQMYEVTGVDLENIVYYKDETHYFVMTTKKQSLIDKGVLKIDCNDVNKLLSPENMDIAALYNYAREAASYATDNALPFYEFALNHYGKPDVALFDFTSVYAADNACRVMVSKGHRLLVQLVGDSLVEPFWPTGSGIGRGFLSVLDAAWAFRAWGESPELHPMLIVSEREAIYRLLAQTTPENLNPNHAAYTINPSTRYKTVHKSAFMGHRVRSLYSSDKSRSIEMEPIAVPAPVSGDVLQKWAALNVNEVRDLATPKNVITIVKRYRPDLVKNINGEAIYNLLFKLYDIPPFGTNLDEGNIMNFLSQLYHTFKGEVPYISRTTDIYNSLKRERKTLGPIAVLTPAVMPVSTISAAERKSRKRRVAADSLASLDVTATTSDRKENVSPRITPVRTQALQIFEGAPETLTATSSSAKVNSQIYTDVDASYSMFDQTTASDFDSAIVPSSGFDEEDRINIVDGLDDNGSALIPKQTIEEVNDKQTALICHLQRSSRHQEDEVMRVHRVPNKSDSLKKRSSGLAKRFSGNTSGGGPSRDDYRHRIDDGTSSRRDGLHNENAKRHRIPAPRLKVKDRATAFANLLKNVDNSSGQKNQIGDVDKRSRIPAQKVKERADEIAKLLKMGSLGDWENSKDATSLTPDIEYINKPKEVGKLNLSKISHNLKLKEFKQPNKTYEGLLDSIYYLSSEDDSQSDSNSDDTLTLDDQIQRMGGLGITSQVDFKEKIKTVENLLQQMGDGTSRTSPKSKPKDLLRSVGKIGKDDWNIKEIEKKIEANRLGRPMTKLPEKVPKWDKEQFLRSKRRLTTNNTPDEKWQAVDETIVKLDLKLRDSGRPEHGTKKVADLANMFVPNKDSEVTNNNTAAETVKESKKPWHGMKVVGINCAACDRRVFAAESLVADGIQFHKSCFRCGVCKAALRPGSYTFERTNRNLFCQRHTKAKNLANVIYATSTIQDAEPLIILPTTTAPERISSIDITEGGGEIDEDEWTDRNFLASGTSEADKSSDDSSSDDSYSDAESYNGDEQVQRESTPNVNVTFHRHINYASDDWYGDDDYSGDGAESSEKDSCSRLHEAREARLQALPADVRHPVLDSSEAESETSESSSDRSSATAVSTDSEFEEETVAAPEPPAITVTHVAPIEEWLHQRETQYPLNRAKSSGGIATKRALELKRRYLLGESVQPIVRKSDSTSRLDTKLEAFQSTITEFQKLLNPAPVQQKPRESTVTFQSLNQIMPDVVLNVRKEPDLLSKTDVSLRCPNGKTENHTPIEEKNDEDIVNLDSSSTESSVTETVTKSVPRVEVHDEGGELIQLDSLIILPDDEEEKVNNVENPPEQIEIETPQISKDSDSSESFKYATLPLTDTDWEWGADNTVLDDCILDECRSQRNVSTKNPRTLSGPKVIHDAKNITAISSHVCGKTSPTIAYANASDHFQFADEGEQDAPVNPMSTRNDGYMELVDDEYLDYSPDNDRSMTYILKKSEMCPTVTKKITINEDLPSKAAQDCHSSDIVDKELHKLSNTKSEPSLSFSSLLPSHEKVQEVKREREQQTEVVRRLVLDRLGKSPLESRKSYRKPRQLPACNPPPPPPLLSDTLVPEHDNAVKPARPTLPSTTFSPPLEEPKHNRIIDGLTNLFSKWHSEPVLSTQITSINPSHSTGALPTEAPPVPPLPAEYCPQSTSEGPPRHRSKVSHTNDADERDAMLLWFEARWARLVARRRHRDLRRSQPDDVAAQRLARIERKLSRPLNADQQAAAVAELMQVSAQRDAHSAMLAADRRRKRNP